MAFVISVLVAVLLWFLAPAAFQAVLMICACAYFVAWVVGQIQSAIK